MPIINNIKSTWDNITTTFTAIKMDVTDTNSASGSKLLDLLVGGTSKFSVNKDGSQPELFLDPTTGVAHVEGKIFYDTATRCHISYNDQSTSAMSLGREMWTRCVNKTGVQINDGDVVYISGSSGNKPTIALADRDSDATSRLIGLATHDIADNAEGEVAVAGIVRNLDTSAFTEGDTVYLSSTAGGYATSVGGVGFFDVKIGIVLNAHATIGEILVQNERLARATTSEPGLMQKATPTQALDGTQADVFADVVGMKAAIDAASVVLDGNVAKSRAVNTLYTNATGKVMNVSIQGYSVTANSRLYVEVAGVTIRHSYVGGGNGSTSISFGFLVPIGATYKLILSAGSATLSDWNEASL